MRCAILILLLLNSTAWAEGSSILVKTEWLVNGKSIGKPELRVLPGEPRVISHGAGKKESMRMKVLARPADEKMDEIFLDLDFRYQAGERTIHSTPQVIAKAGDEAFMTLEESTKGEKIQLKVMAKPLVR